MNVAEFGQSIKAKYPQYANVDDETLGQKVLEKHPEYSDRVDANPNATKGVLDAFVKGAKNIKEGIVQSGQELDETLNTPTTSPAGTLAKYVKTATGLMTGIAKPFIAEPIATAMRAGGEVIQNATGYDINEETANAVGKLVQAGMDTEVAKKTVNAYNEYVASNPESKMAGAAIGDIAEMLGYVVGLKGAKGAANVAETAGRNVINTGIKGAEEGIEAVTKKAGNFAERVKEIGAGAKDKFLESDFGEKIAESVAPIDNTTRKVIDPLSSIPKENIPNIPAETIEAAKEATSGKLEFYLNKARRATSNPSLPTPLEFAGKKAEEALKVIGDKMSKYVKMKKAETEAVKDKLITGVQDLKTKLMDSLGEAAGVELKEGEFVAKAGRSMAVSDPADLGLIKTISSKLESLGENPTFRQVDDTVDFLQDILYKKKANLAVPINSKIESIVKKITGELNGKLRASGGQLYKKANQRLSGMIEARDLLNKALGYDGNKGGSLMKRVFSPTDGGTKKLFGEIKRITGIDLNEEATLAKFAMEQLGDARQANLLEQLELIKGSLGAGKGSFLTEFVKNVAKKAGEKVVGDPVDRARRILQK